MKDLTIRTTISLRRSEHDALVKLCGPLSLSAFLVTCALGPARTRWTAHLSNSANFKVCIEVPENTTLNEIISACSHFTALDKTNTLNNLKNVDGQNINIIIEGFSQRMEDVLELIQSLKKTGAVLISLCFNRAST